MGDTVIWSAACFTLLQKMKICCNIQVIIYLHQVEHFSIRNTKSLSLFDCCRNTRKFQWIHLYIKNIFYAVSYSFSLGLNNKEALLFKNMRTCSDTYSNSHLKFTCINLEQNNIKFFLLLLIIYNIENFSLKYSIEYQIRKINNLHLSSQLNLKVKKVKL